jgi:hypothetical protein
MKVGIQGFYEYPEGIPCSDSDEADEKPCPHDIPSIEPSGFLS